MWEYYDRINLLPAGLWENKISGGNVCLDRRLLEVSERMFRESQFVYLVKKNNYRVEALVMFMITGKKIAETGTPETSGTHFWFDTAQTGLTQFIEESSLVIKKIYPDVDRIIYRDFIGISLDMQGPRMSIREALAFSELTVPVSVNDMNGYISTLKSKYRYQVKQYMNAVTDTRYRFEAVTEFTPLIDELYPLYADVCSRSKEYEAPPYPKEYFHTVKEVFGDEAVMMTVKDITENKFLGFMLLLYNSRSCVHQYIGFERIPELFLWHNLTLYSIGDSIRKGVCKIYMGVTNSSAKHKFGAVSYPNSFAEIIL